MGQLGAKGDARHPDEFRVTLGELAEAAKLNMAEDLQAITADLWANKQCCTCQTREVLCPCCPGAQAAKDGGECFCGLFKGH